MIATASNFKFNRTAARTEWRQLMSAQIRLRQKSDASSYSSDSTFLFAPNAMLLILHRRTLNLDYGSKIYIKCVIDFCSNRVTGDSIVRRFNF